MTSDPPPSAQLGETFVGLFFETQEALLENVSHVVTIRARSEVEARAVIGKIAEFLDARCVWLLWSHILPCGDVDGIHDGGLEPAALYIPQARL